ncbi:MAG: sigma-54 dependent transcriptional regulator [Thermodesulfobacteriaceae bacterium]|nr:sigma-54 dependent transcriptional regulator [Thermodesulfobacteriaceae bacterium]MDW8135897.1 sigma-54 dependent transcriptional regulator [Thermodesulfobacterium sp.]
MKGKVFLIGDSLEVKFLRDTLKERNLEVHWFSKKEFSKEILSHKLIDVVVFELSYEETFKPELVDEFLKLGFFHLIFLAEKAELERAIEFIKRGAYDFKLLSTPMEILEKAILYVLEEKRIFWEEEVFLTQDPKMIKILKMLEEVAQSKVPVLLVGESGTGKELLSKFIHFKSPRKKGPYVAINCAALPETLLESELFGYEKGAFSGANFRKKGKIELADGGTLLLDEITEMRPQLQSKLLRVLQEGEVDKLGGYHPVKVDVRIVSTTNKDIEKEVLEGNFRRDLYYRINVITVKIPPLRERKEDLEFLSKYFLENFSQLYKKEIKNFSPSAWQFLKSYSFPGNVRELKNMIERAVITAKGEWIEVENLTDPLASTFKAGTEVDKLKIEDFKLKPLFELEKEAILKALEVSKGNKSKAAELLGITVRTLRNKLKLYQEQGILKI